MTPNLVCSLLCCFSGKFEGVGHYSVPKLHKISHHRDATIHRTTRQLHHGKLLPLVPQQRVRSESSEISPLVDLSGQCRAGRIQICGNRKTTALPGPFHRINGFKSNHASASTASLPVPLPLPHYLLRCSLPFRGAQKHWNDGNPFDALSIATCPSSGSGWDSMKTQNPKTICRTVLKSLRYQLVLPPPCHFFLGNRVTFASWPTSQDWLGHPH